MRCWWRFSFPSIDACKFHCVGFKSSPWGAWRQVPSGHRGGGGRRAKSRAGRERDSPRGTVAADGRSGIVRQVETFAACVCGIRLCHGATRPRQPRLRRKWGIVRATCSSSKCLGCHCCPRRGCHLGACRLERDGRWDAWRCADPGGRRARLVREACRPRHGFPRQAGYHQPYLRNAWPACHGRQP